MNGRWHIVQIHYRGCFIHVCLARLLVYYSYSAVEGLVAAGVLRLFLIAYRAYLIIDIAVIQRLINVFLLFSSAI